MDDICSFQRVANVINNASPDVVAIQEVDSMTPVSYTHLNGNPYGARVANYGDSYVYALNTNMDLTFKIMKGLTLSVQGLSLIHI